MPSASWRIPLAVGGALLLLLLARHLSRHSKSAGIADRACANLAAQIDPAETVVTVAAKTLPDCKALRASGKQVQIAPNTQSATFVWDQGRSAWVRQTGVMRLPRGVLELSEETVLPAGAHDLEITGDPAGTVLKMSGSFHGRALFVATAGRRIRFTNFTIDGNRDALEQRTDLPPYNVPFANFTRNSGVLAENVDALEVSNMNFRQIAGFAILVSSSKNVTIERVRIEAAGSRNAKGRNNTTGGILLEEGTKFFHIRNNELTGIRGNGIWTHSLYTSPRNAEGEIQKNRFRTIGRDAIQVGHATKIQVADNQGQSVGYPPEIVDMEHQAIPAAIDTSGNVDQSVYEGNHFEEVNGKCMDLDGFHNGEIKGNTCRNRKEASAYPYGNYGIVMNNTNPDMQSEHIRIEDNEIDGALFGGIFVIGSHNQILHNRLRNLNQAHRAEDLLKAGIYLGKGAERPAKAQNNRIENNEIEGYGMQGNCIKSDPAIKPSSNKIAGNVCRSSKAGTKLHF